MKILYFCGGMILGKFIALNMGERIFLKRDFELFGNQASYELGIPWGFTCFDRKVTTNADGSTTVEISWNVRT